MKKLTLVFAMIAFLGLRNESQAQLQNGSTAPNFTLSDINGNQHTLYDYLDQGKTVYIDFFACHCPYCWNYHSTHALADLYDEHGPNTASNDVFVFAIELDPNNGLNEFYGISGSTQGDWVAGTNYPQINPEGSDRSSIISSYAVNSYPLIYAICPDKTIKVIGTKNKDLLYAHISTCALLGIDESNTIDIQVTQQDNVLTVEYNNDNNANLSLNLVDIQGKKVSGSNFYEGSSTLSTTGVQSGIYFIQITENNTIIASRKVQF